MKSEKCALHRNKKYSKKFLIDYIQIDKHASCV